MQSKRQEYIVFQLSNEFFCIELQSLESIVNKMPIRHVPNTPPHILGVTELDEQIVPIIDLKKRMDLPSKAEFPEDALILFFEQEGHLLGFLADTLFELKEHNEDLKNEFNYIPTSVRIFSSGTLRMKDKLFGKGDEEKEELVIVLDTRKIYEVIEKDFQKSKEGAR